MLISPAIFDPNKCEGSKRGIGNIVYIRGVWLDFEDGDLKPDEFPSLFPYVRMVIFNTFRHTKEKPRFRVFIPTNGIMSPEAYKKIWDQIALKLKDAGYSLEKPKKGSSLRERAWIKAREPRPAYFTFPVRQRTLGKVSLRILKTRETRSIRLIGLKTVLLISKPPNFAASTFGSKIWSRIKITSKLR